MILFYIVKNVSKILILSSFEKHDKLSLTFIILLMGFPEFNPIAFMKIENVSYIIFSYS